jgi:hypothetical protein
MARQTQLANVEASGYVYYAGETRVSFDRIEQDPQQFNPLAGSFWLNVTTSTDTTGDTPERRDIKVLISPVAMTGIVTSLLEDATLRQAAMNAVQEIGFRERQAGR